jgi:hypothetical protein
MVTFLARQARAFVASQARSTFGRDHWNVGVVDAPIERFLDPSDVPPPSWHAPVRGPDVYVADPFGVAGHDDVLVEAFAEATQRGTIEVLDDAAGGCVLPLGVHASYPYLFTHDGAVWCTPEVAQSRAVRLFRATRFPDAWEEVAVLVPDVAAVDPTVCFHDGRWWLFFTDKDVDANAVLHVWHARELLGPWEPHAANPVKTDVRSARPAGTPFVVAGTLYRPAQDCAATYGGGIVVNALDVLTPTRFREHVVARVPPWATGGYDRGCHTLTAWGERTLVDGKRRALTGRGALRRVTAKLRRAARR